MNWEKKLKQFLAKEFIDQRDYDEFVKIRETLKSEEEIDKYMQYGEGIYLKLDENVITSDD